MLEAIFNETTITVTLTGLFQWDFGQKLYIKGLSLPEVLEVHFANNREKEAIVRTAITQGDYSVVSIPDEMLEKNADIIAYVYLVGNDYGETIRSVILKIEPRLKPHNYVSAYPDAEILLHDVLDKINKNIDSNTKFKEEINVSVKEVQKATQQCYAAISSLQLEIFDMNGGDPFTQHSDNDMDANGGYPA